MAVDIYIYIYTQPNKLNRQVSLIRSLPAADERNEISASPSIDPYK